MKSSQGAFDLIVEQEVSSGPVYTKRYSHFEWPGEASGPTVGVGYDCGYCTKDECRTDWTGIVPDATVATLLTAVGCKGPSGQSFVRAHGKSVTITWEQAEKQFRDRELPKWEARVLRALPNAELLQPDSFGALVSLAYNRGVGGFTAQSDRFMEMRTIRSLMVTKSFAKIPLEIRGMKRLWNNGLVARREQEALLFERGLAVASGQKPKPIPTRKQVVLKKAVQAGSATGAGAGGSAAAAAPSTHTHWIAPLAALIGIVVAVCVTLYVMRHRLIPRDAPAEG